MNDSIYLWIMNSVLKSERTEELEKLYRRAKESLLKGDYEDLNDLAKELKITDANINSRHFQVCVYSKNVYIFVDINNYNFNTLKDVEKDAILADGKIFFRPLLEAESPKEVDIIDCIKEYLREENIDFDVKFSEEETEKIRTQYARVINDFDNNFGREN